MKEFNVTGTCIPNKHYMVDTTDKINAIITLIEKDSYFTINRARQYGKTTTLSLLNQTIQDQYHVIWLSFEGMGDLAFQNEIAFVKNFIYKVKKELDFIKIDSNIVAKWGDTTDYDMDSFNDAFEYLSDKITALCKQVNKEIILMIDEVDKSSDNQIFLNFLGMLRNKYLARSSGRDYTFKSVILAGVYDIKNLKIKLRPDEEKKYNSPWNIAVDFNIDMSFSAKEIATMLQDYEQDYHTGMDIEAISNQIYFYTSGYPFLVSRLCKWIDEDGNREWTLDNVRVAEHALLQLPCTLFDDLAKNYENHADLQLLIDDILFGNKEYLYAITDPVIQFGAMLGILKNQDNKVAISNVIFDTILYNHVLSKKNREDISITSDRNQFIINGRLDMSRVLVKFQEIMKAEYREENDKFLEKQGRLLFLCFLKPIINGTGFYFVEPETRNSNRMDIVVVYGSEEFIIELKIWHGTEYRKDGIQQLEGYIESRNNTKGYLVSFSFLKNKKYTKGYLSSDETIKEIFEIVV
ncbi:MAG: AAA-like domain-containing protein [Eubacteriales bacterium]|nr:AAA-like domain-containing protein [Eubacteriales bacterium]